MRHWWLKGQAALAQHVFAGQFHNFGRKLHTLYPIAKLKIK